MSVHERTDWRIQVLNKMIGKEVPVADARGVSERHAWRRRRRRRERRVDRHGCRSGCWPWLKAATQPLFSAGVGGWGPHAPAPCARARLPAQARYPQEGSAADRWEPDVLRPRLDPATGMVPCSGSKRTRILMHTGRPSTAHRHSIFQRSPLETESRTASRQAEPTQCAYAELGELIRWPIRAKGRVEHLLVEMRDGDH